MKILEITLLILLISIAKSAHLRQQSGQKVTQQSQAQTESESEARSGIGYIEYPISPDKHLRKVFFYNVQFRMYLDCGLGAHGHTDDYWTIHKGSNSDVYYQCRNGQWLGVHDNHHIVLKPAALDWERFSIQSVGNGIYCLRNLRFNQFLGMAPNVRVNNAPWCQAWEQWRFYQRRGNFQPNRRWYVRGVTFGKYLKRTGGDALVASGGRDTKVWFEPRERGAYVVKTQGAFGELLMNIGDKWTYKTTSHWDEDSKRKFYWKVLEPYGVGQYCIQSYYNSVTLRAGRQKVLWWHDYYFDFGGRGCRDWERMVFE